MVFGVFDGIHEGHKAFFREAKTHGDYLIAVVAQDYIVERLKGKRPMIDMAQRFADLEALDGVDEVEVGDHELGVYDVVIKHEPNVIALGYDQQSLKKDLEAWLKGFDPLDKLRASWKPEIVMLSAHEPNKYHSSLLNKND